MSHSRRRMRALPVAGGFVAVLVAVGLAWWTGLVQVNDPSRDRFPVRGVDVSRYQGSIDWPVLAAQGVEFAFIKATEGSSWVDPAFATNLAGATGSGLRTGAYHFFSFESPGAGQAENVVATVPVQPDQLPVAVDVEFYGGFWVDQPPVDEVRRELSALLERLDGHYPTPAILYTTGEVYSRYIAGAFPGVEVWIRDVWRQPSLSDGRAWTFWQFSDRYRLDGYRGEETFIDLNVYAGSRTEWERYRR